MFSQVKEFAIEDVKEEDKDNMQQKFLEMIGGGGGGAGKKVNRLNSSINTTLFKHR